MLQPVSETGFFFRDEIVIVLTSLDHATAQMVVYKA